MPYPDPPDCPGRHPGSKSRGLRLYCLRSEGESVVLVGICKNACAVTRAPSARNPEAQLPRRSQTPPPGRTWLRFEFYPRAGPPTLSGVPMAVDLDRIGRASLKELGDIRIDDVLSFIDRGIENMPSYMDLYRRWESQQWKVAHLDFTLDREDWLESRAFDKKVALWARRLVFNS